MIDSGSRILLDTVALVYFLEQNAQHAKRAERIFTRIESGELHGIMASLVFAELLVPLYRSGDSKVAADLSNQLLGFQNLEIIPLSTEISMLAARLRADYGLRTPDAIHGATAIRRASGILTNDKRLKVLAGEGISVWLFDALE